MTDMLVKLYNLPESGSSISNRVAPEIKIRKPMASEKSLVVGWVRENFGESWGNDYGYAIIGWAGPQEFYEKAVGAVAIPDSTPGIWKDWLGETE